MTEPLFSPQGRLPRGPHRLPREEVHASQRMRLLAAVTELVAEDGYTAVTMGRLAERAGVSRGSFYDHFADKEACYLEAYDHFATALADSVVAALAGDPPLSEFIDRGLAAYIGMLEREPAAARAFVVEMEAAGSAARHRRRTAMHGFAALLAGRHAAIREQLPELGGLPDRAYLGLAVGVRELAREELEHPSSEGSTPDYAGLHADLVALVSAAIAGAGSTTGV